jgi:hypothetical protein
VSLLDDVEAFFLEHEHRGDLDGTNVTRCASPGAAWRTRSSAPCPAAAASACGIRDEQSFANVDSNEVPAQ